jgi:myo-inositol 2-dehydrogenase/D-chiro-inositol 1-dehydrogenase
MSTLNRRDLLLGSLAAAGAAVRPSHAQETGETINAGFIGTGNRGSYLLKSTLTQPGVKVVAVCDIKPDRLDRAATTAGRDKPDTYTDWRRVIDRKDVNAVYIATPCDLHVEMAIAAFQAGKHIYCEKPLGVTPESINQLWRAGKDAKTAFQTGLNMRSSVRNKTVIDKIHEGIAGKVIMIRAHRTASDDLDHEGPSKDWFFNAKRSGDVIVEMAVHNLDVCNWVADSRPERAGGFGGTLLWVNDPPGRTNMDGYTLSYEYANGIKLSFVQVFFHPGGMPGGGQATWVYGVNGGVDLSTATYYPRERKAAPVKLMEGESRRGESDHIAVFLNAIRTGAKTTADLRVGCIAALTSILGREAIYRKKVMTWTDLGVDL